MNKIYCIGSLFNRIDQLEKLLLTLDPSDKVYCIGNLGFDTSQHQSQITYLYIYNIIHQNNPKLPKIYIIKGKHETEDYFKDKFFNSLVIESGYQFIKNMNLSQLFDFNQPFPTQQEIYSFFVNQKSIEIINDKFVLISGYIDPNLPLTDQIIDLNYENNIFINSPFKINLNYYHFCKNNKLKMWSKKSQIEFMNSNINYLGFKTLDQYNMALKNNFKEYFFIFGHGYDPMFKKNLSYLHLSHMVMIDGGMGKAYNDESWFYFLPSQEQLNIVCIDEDTQITYINL